MRGKLVFVLIVLLAQQTEQQTCIPGQNGCATCSGTICSTCQNDLWKDSTGADCQACSSVIPNCLTCTAGATQTQCSFCDPLNKYYLQDPTTCTQCSGNTFVNAAGNACDTCDNVIIGCVACIARLDGTSCTSCNLGLSLWLFPSSKQCGQCYEALPGCFNCVLALDLSSTWCTLCSFPSQHALVNNTCEQCVVPQYLSIDRDACLPCIEAIPGCYRCRENKIGTVCQGCSVFPVQHYRISSFECQPCDHSAGQFVTAAFDGCVSCQSLITGCEQCGPFPTGQTYCQRCRVSEQYYGQITQCIQCMYQTTDDWLTLDLRGCDTCANIIPDCQACAAGSAGTICTQCPVERRFALTSPTSCTQCSSSEFVTLTLDGCESCADAVEGCLQCEAGASGWL